MFSELQGFTSVIEHDIVTEPSVKVQVKPYRITEAHRKTVSGEIQRMLEFDIIEESKSQWSSQIVMIPKASETLQFCIDSRKLNKVSKFDM